MKGRTARDVVERERRFPAGHKNGYAGFVQDMANLKQKQLEAWRDQGGKGIKVFQTNDVLAAYQSYPPEYFSQAYEIDDAEFDGELRLVQRKYLSRFKNIRRAWARLLQFLPEAMSSDRKYRILEMSTAHGATLEILKHFGHDVTGNDYSNAALEVQGGMRSVDREFGEDLLQDREEEKAEWRYRAIIESLNINVELFDAGLCPYPFEDNAFDIILCFDALEHYCHPRDWLNVVDEFTRLSSQTVALEINPVRKERIDDPEYIRAVNDFCDAMLKYSNRGFRCVSTSASFNQPRFFKLMKIG